MKGKITLLLQTLKSQYIASEQQLKLLVSSIIAQQHVLLIGPPGAGKTYLAKTISRLIGGSFKRIQGNPDILPSDITGFKVYVVQGEPRFVPGPLFANIVMIDEINRISTRAQAALLEAMQEGTVTVDGETFQLPDPQIIIATMIPYTTGTYPLPEVLLDRFGVAITIGLLDASSELQLIGEFYEVLFKDVEPVIYLEDLKKIFNFINNNVYMHERVKKYLIGLISELRKDPRIRFGPSTRVTLSMYHLAKIYAFINDRDYVIPDDIKLLAKPVIEHRLFLKPEAITEGLTPGEILDEALSRVEVPKY